MLATKDNRLRSGDDKHGRFTQWAKDRGVEIYGVKPAAIPGRGMGLITTKTLQDGNRLLFIPEKAMFKPDSAFLKQEDLDRASPQVQLAISAMQAFGPDDSALKTWIETWPTLDDFKQSMPMCWTKDVQEMLPPSVHQPLERQLADYEKDRNTVKKLCERHNWSEDDLLYYWLIVNSRSFHWKPPQARAGVMVMCPFIDYINHGPTGTTCRVRQTAKGYEVVADRNYAATRVLVSARGIHMIAAGEEIFATYGAHSNDKLLVHYGFICAHQPNGHSPDDDIRIDHLILPKLSADVRERLQDVAFLGCYSLLPATNELCFRTQVAVRAELQTCNEWEYFVACGEDLSEDFTAIVREFVTRLLLEYRHIAIGYHDAPGMIGLRWNQIIDAIDAFCRLDNARSE